MGAGPTQRDLLCAQGTSGSLVGVEHRIYAGSCFEKLKKDSSCLKYIDRGATK